MLEIPELNYRDDCSYIIEVPTRWNDNDMLGHVNNVIYYSYFEAVVVRFLMEEGGLDWLNENIVPLAVETLCKFRRSLVYPDLVQAGLRVGQLGNSSVVYSIALFTKGIDSPAATGHFVHVYVDRETDSPVPIPKKFRNLYERFS
mgnify:CR=1 FL=1